MNKRIASFLLLLAMLTSMAACGEGAAGLPPDCGTDAAAAALACFTFSASASAACAPLPSYSVLIPIFKSLSFFAMVVGGLNVQTLQGLGRTGVQRIGHLFGLRQHGGVGVMFGLLGQNAQLYRHAANVSHQLAFFNAYRVTVKP